MIRGAILTALMLGLTACSSLQRPIEHDPADDMPYPEFAHRDPTGEGMRIAKASDKEAGALHATGPIISVGPQWADADRSDMQSLVDTAAASLMSSRLTGYGDTLKFDYPRAWLAKSLGYKNAAEVMAIANRPEIPLRYVPATVVPFDGWAQTGGVNGQVRISVSPKLLDRWRSPDVVMRACAVNTMAHEISHTLSRSERYYLYAFTDTGVGREARRTPPASYLTGNVALCDYLLENGRIKTDEFKQCVAIWYRPGGFQSGRCDDFPSDKPIR